MPKPVKHSVSIKGHRTSFSLEDDFWQELNNIASERRIPVAQIITSIDETRHPEQNLSSALRIYVLDSLKTKLGSDT